MTYLTEMERQKNEQEFCGSHEEFLKSCQIRLVLSKAVEPEVRRRCWELVNRTNQLTLSAHRYTEQEFAQMEGWSIKCNDKYGDYGIVGFISIKGSEICEFVMSCRVAMKRCEQSVLVAMVRRFGELKATLVRTGRNGALISAFEAMPFVDLQENGVCISVIVRDCDEIDQVYVNEVNLEG